MFLDRLLCSAWHLLNVDLSVWDVTPVACCSSCQQSDLSLLSRETEYLLHFIFWKQCIIDLLPIQEKKTVIYKLL